MDVTRSDLHDTATRATNGDKVRLVLDCIKADKQAQVERFYDLFWGNVAAWPAADCPVRRQTRLLYPVGPNDDGTYTYAWLMDPLIEGADYDIESLLTKMYGAEQARDHLALWVDAHAAEQVVHDLRQT